MPEIVVLPLNKSHAPNYCVPGSVPLRSPPPLFISLFPLGSNRGTVLYPLINSLVTMVLNYASLDPKKSEIRLLTIFPHKEFHAPISCSLHVASLDNITEFEALSYVWGDPSIREVRDVDNRPLLITVNLVAALRRLRRVQSPRVIGADAICIN